MLDQAALSLLELGEFGKRFIQVNRLHITV